MKTSLQDLGLDDWIVERANDVLRPGQLLARVSAVDRESYLVRDSESETYAELSGRVRFTADSGSDLPCVGDWVCVQFASSSLAIIHAVVPRKSELRRKTAGKTVDFQMIASNLDAAFIVQAFGYDFNIRRLERYIVVINEGGIEPVLILSKTDLATPQELEEATTSIRSAGIDIPILPLSGTTGVGIQALEDQLVARNTYAFLGSSGVGKTTLVNRLLGREALVTRAVRDIGKGAHTTTRRQLLVLETGTMLIDTPGMRELGLLGAGDGIDNSFSEFGELSAECRFSDCTHTNEPDCAVLSAVENGIVPPERYESYIKLKKETEHYDMSYLERRKRDKEFGRMVKFIKKHSRRND